MILKNFLYLTLILLMLPFGINHIQAQCTTYAAGPYTDQAIDIAGCDGESVNAPYSAWQNEVYFSSVVAGGNYTFELVGCDAINWGGMVEITVIDGGTDDGAGNITGGTTTVGTGCSVSFTAVNTATAFFIVTTVGGCGTPELQTDNGVPTITTNSGVACGVCGDSTCEATENYCSCAADCICVGAAPVFVTGYDTGNFAGTPIPVAYCSSEVNTGGVNAIPEAVYVTFAPFGNQPCVTDWNVTSDFGTLFASSDPISTLAAPIGNFSIALVELTDADLTASGGMITITFTDATTGNGCTYDLLLDMSTAVDLAGAPWAGTAAAACPGVCGPPSATFVSYDCTGPSVTVDVTDLGTPTTGSLGFTGQVRAGDGTVITSGIPLSIGNVTFPLPDNTQVYDIFFIDGITGGCDVGFANNPLLYGDCRQAAGPSAGCSFTMDDTNLDGSFESGLWAEVPAGSGVINTGFPLDDVTHLFLGAAGAANTEAANQTITIPVGTSAMMHYWIWFPLCADATDVFELTIDGGVVQTFNGADVRCGGNWVEESVSISAFADGGSHVIEFTLTETGSGLGDGATAILIDDVIIETCGSSLCPPEYTAANGNRLTGTESGVADYETDGRIESEQTIDGTAMVDYDSALEIELLPDFNTIIGAAFHAFIEGCMGANLSGNNVVRQSKNIDTTAKPNSSKHKAKPITSIKNINRKNSNNLQLKTMQNNYRSGK